MADEKQTPNKTLTDAERGELKLKTRELSRMLFRASQENKKGEGKADGADRDAAVAARKESWAKERKSFQMTARRLLRLMERSETVDVTFKFSEEDLAKAAKGRDDDESGDD